jgi:acetoin utilization deacetylase AcuC-like enzyme
VNPIALIQDKRYLDHLTGAMHPERPERLKVIDQMLRESSFLKKAISLEPREATEEEIALVHDRSLIEEVKATQNRDSTYLDPDTHASRHSWEAAKLAAGGLLVAVDELLFGKIEEAFAFPRPPGHHAERDHAMGFCLFNNVAIAAEYAIRKKGIKKVVILDFDVHHGNGTQHIFEERPDVFYISTHRYPFYPGTGAASEIGKGAGKGYTLNLPMDAESTDADYAHAFREKIVPAIVTYQPELLIVSAGFDAHQLDPLGGMEVTNKGYCMMAEKIEEMRKKCGTVPVLYALEGGYSLKGLSESVKEVVEIMLNQKEIL